MARTATENPAGHGQDAVCSSCPSPLCTGLAWRCNPSPVDSTLSSRSSFFFSSSSFIKSVKFSSTSTGLVVLRHTPISRLLATTPSTCTASSLLYSEKAYAETILVMIFDTRRFFFFVIIAVLLRASGQPATVLPGVPAVCCGWRPSPVTVHPCSWKSGSLPQPAAR